MFLILCCFFFSSIQSTASSFVCFCKSTFTSIRNGCRLIFQYLGQMVQTKGSQTKEFQTKLVSEKTAFYTSCENIAWLLWSFLAAASGYCSVGMWHRAWKLFHVKENICIIFLVAVCTLDRCPNVMVADSWVEHLRYVAEYRCSRLSSDGCFYWLSNQFLFIHHRNGMKLWGIVA